MHQYFVIYKPFQTLSQFSPSPGKKSLKDYFSVHRDIYPVGRLDYDSEGLLILTNDPALNHRLLNPKFTHEREYWVQSDGDITIAALEKLSKGVEINIDGKMYKTRKCEALKFDHPPIVPERMPPVRFRKSIPTSWSRIILNEGKNRQVRRMMAKVGFPVIRLIRYRIEKLELRNLQPGEMIELSKEIMHEQLFGK